jgi:hypothetical protein
MGEDNTPLGLLWERIFRIALAVFGQQATTGRTTFPGPTTLKTRFDDFALVDSSFRSENGFSLKPPDIAQRLLAR